MNGLKEKVASEERAAVSAVHSFYLSQQDKSTGSAFTRVVKLLSEQLSDQSVDVADSMTDTELLVEVVTSLLQKTMSERRSKQYEMLLAGARNFAKLIEQAGGTYRPQEVSDLLKISGTAVKKRVKEGALLALERGKHSDYPVWQFTDSKVVPGFEEVLKRLGNIGSVAKVTFFLAGDDDLGMSRIDYLRKYGPDDKILNSAARMGHQGAA